MSCTVCLLAHTPEPDATVAAAARICYSDVTAAELLGRESAQLSERLLNELLESGHLSPFEHASFTFGVDGLSRVASHQLVRHRLASYSQQSQRYVSMDRTEVVLPPSIAADPEARRIFEAQAARAHEGYRQLVARGIPAEDARFLLPHGWETRLVFTMNARELLHFFDLRLCRRAQWEIRGLARLLLRECRAKAPVLFKTAGPSCVRCGVCQEARSCGNPYKNMEALLANDG